MSFIYSFTSSNRGNCKIIFLFSKTSRPDQWV